MYSYIVAVGRDGTKFANKNCLFGPYTSHSHAQHLADKMDTEAIVYDLKTKQPSEAVRELKEKGVIVALESDGENKWEDALGKFRHPTSFEDF